MLWAPGTAGTWDCEGSGPSRLPRWTWNPGVCGASGAPARKISFRFSVFINFLRACLILVTYFTVESLRPVVSINAIFKVLSPDVSFFPCLNEFEMFHLGH